MSNVLAIVLPVFGLIALGFAAAKTRLISERAGDGLADYVFALAVPALIFRTLSESQAPLTDSPWGYWISYFAAAAVAWAIGMVLARRVFLRDARESVIHGFCSAQSNTVFLGIPLILQAYGDAGAVPLFLLLAIHLPLMMGAASLLIESADARDDGFRLGQFVKTLVTHPILLALLAGVLAQILGVRAPSAIKPILDGLAASASPVALVAMGLALSRYGFRSDPKAALVATVLKLVLHPLLVLILARYVFALDPVFTGVAVLFAALPSGINGYLLAVRYRTGERFASGAIAVSTAFSVITVAIWLVVLGV
jgi:malonate transporter and related proteins